MKCVTLSPAALCLSPWFTDQVLNQHTDELGGNSIHADRYITVCMLACMAAAGGEGYACVHGCMHAMHCCHIPSADDPQDDVTHAPVQP